MEHLSLFTLNKTIGEALAKNLEPSYWVVAEIGEMRHNQKGHCYLELVEKEDDKIKAKSRATIWSYTYRNLSGWFESLTGQSLSAGMKILCNVTVQYHEVYGFSLNIRDIDAQYTLGERAKRRQEILQKLMDDGVFEMNKELNLPIVPQRIAVISSKTAAGFGDFMDQLTGNEFGFQFDIQLFQSTMQGDQAAASIIESMHQVFSSTDDFDLLVIIRGGGASLDLDCFDSYELGSHIAQFPLPVVTGIGHERDETVADMVAHTKMKTPTAVAEFIISGVRNYEMKLEEHFNTLVNKLNETIEEDISKLSLLSFRFQRNTQKLLNEQHLILNQREQTLKFGHQNALKFHERKLDELKYILSKHPKRLVQKQQSMLDHLDKELNVLDPEQVFKRGYSITTVNGINIHQLKQIEKGANITTITENLVLESTIAKSKQRKKS